MRTTHRVDDHRTVPRNHNWLRWRWPFAPASAIFDLNGPAHYIHWHFFQMSVANVVVILLMIAVFVAAILLPFPHRGRER
jgi:hypothetical protein